MKVYENQKTNPQLVYLAYLIYNKTRVFMEVLREKKKFAPTGVKLTQTWNLTQELITKILNKLEQS